MKKIIFIAVIAVLAAVNVSIAFNSDKSVVNLSLTNIMALATGEIYYCSICGDDVEFCKCDIGITCDHAGCWGKVCHQQTWNPICPCRENGNPFSFC